MLYVNGASEDVAAFNLKGVTPLHAASVGGHVAVAQWLREAGASVCAPADGKTPMFIACENGHLELAAWLFCAGATGDIRIEHVWLGWTPLFAACRAGHLPVAQWLFDMGAGEDIHKVDKKYGATVLCIASWEKKFDMVLWLLIHGAATDRGSGHVSAAIIRRDMPLGYESLGSEVRFRIEIALAGHRSFMLCLLEMSRKAEAPQEGRALPALRLLRGHESTLMSSIADFTGVARGSYLRVLRECLSALDEVMWPDGTEKEESSESERESEVESGHEQENEGSSSAASIGASEEGEEQEDNYLFRHSEEALVASEGNEEANFWESEEHSILVECSSDEEDGSTTLSELMKIYGAE
jgi:hypothetical protein